MLTSSSNIATDGQSASSSWYRTCCVVLSLKTGRACSLITQFAVTLGSKPRRTPDHKLMSHLRLPQPGRPGPSIKNFQEQGCSVTPSGTGFPFIASYDSQGYNGSILSRPHKSMPTAWEVEIEVEALLRLTVSRSGAISDERPGL
jgi:hypothetical protein